MLSTSKIVNVRFNIIGDEDIKKESSVPITNTELFNNNEPYTGGVYDLHLGTTDNGHKCTTCKQKKDQCLGHFGHITLKLHVLNPMAAKSTLRAWLAMICHHCGKVFIADNRYMGYSENVRFKIAKGLAERAVGTKKKSDDAVVDVTTKKKGISNRCVHCNEEHPAIKVSAHDPLLYIAEYKKGSEAAQSVDLYPHMIKAIFERVSNETVRSLGKSIESHPSRFVIKYIGVPPTNIRPDVRKVGGGRSSNDDLTSMLQMIIRDNNSINAEGIANMDAKFRKMMSEFNNRIYYMIRGTATPGKQKAVMQNTSYAMRLTGKAGRFRKNQLGKRVREMGRSTIIGDPTLRVDEIGIPLQFARVLQKRVVVRSYNRAELMQYVANGRDKYPGCSRVIKKATKRSYTIDKLKDIVLEDGDIVLRDYITGDSVGFNRQPSLTSSNICVVNVVVTDDIAGADKRDESELRDIWAIRMNVISCKYYNADLSLIRHRSRTGSCFVGY
jgi:DNA-directed RNA polymerase subunit A'